MNEQKILSLLGLCMRAGRLVSGEAKCETAIRQGEAKLVVLASDVSANTAKKFNNSAYYYKLPVVTAGTIAQLGHALGKAHRAVAVVTDEGFAKKIAALSDDTTMSE